MVVVGLSIGRIFNETNVSLGPLISSTILDKRMSTTSTNSPSPWATFRITSSGSSCRDASAGPPGSNSFIVQYPSASVKTAPIPTNSLCIA